MGLDYNVILLVAKNLDLPLPELPALKAKFSGGYNFEGGTIWGLFGYHLGMVWVSSENLLLEVCGVSFAYHTITNLGFFEKPK